MILSAQSIITAQNDSTRKRLIEPFHHRTVVGGRSFGLSSCGYDVRVDLSSINQTHVILQRSQFYETERGRFGPTHSHDFMLASTIEHFNMPDYLMGIVHDKSSWARLGLTVQNTVIEPGWRGFLTLELTYQGDDQGEVRIRHGDPIAQIIFHKLDEPTEQPYSGKYQDQERGPQEARFE